MSWVVTDCGRRLDPRYPTSNDARKAAEVLRKERPAVEAWKIEVRDTSVSRKAPVERPKTKKGQGSGNL
jgi:hypothetical protein